MIPMLRRVRSSTMLAAIVSFAAVAACYTLLATEMSGRLSEMARYAPAFDQLAESIARGAATVTSETAGNEAFIYNGKSSIYFGPFPALVRAPLNLLFPSWRGLWGRTCCLVAALLAYLGAAYFFRAMRDRAVGDGHGVRSFWFSLLLAFVFASPLTFLITIPSIWHESILWGFAASMWALYYLALPASIRSSLGLSVAAGCALLSRVTFAIPLIPILAIRAAQELRGLRSERLGGTVPTPTLTNDARTKRLFFLLLPFFSAALFQGWYNYARYDSPLKFYRGTPRDAIVQAGGVFNIARVPYTLPKYFGTGAGRLSSTAPFIVATKDDERPPELFVQEREPSISLLALSPGFVLAALIGVVMVVKNSGMTEALYLLCLAVQPGIVLLYYWVTLRFTADCFPLVTYAAGLALANAHRIPRLLRRTVIVCNFISLVTAPFIIISVMLTLGWGVNRDYRTAIQAKLSAIDSFFGLPVDSPRGPR